MPFIPDHDRNIMDQAIYLPMVLTVLDRDYKIFADGSYKIKKPYLEMIEQTMIAIQKDLFKVKSYLHKNHIKVEKIKSDDQFTTYYFLHNGYESYHNYFNYALRNRVWMLMREYLL